MDIAHKTQQLSQYPGRLFGSDAFFVARLIRKILRERLAAKGFHKKANLPVDLRIFVNLRDPLVVQ